MAPSARVTERYARDGFVLDIGCSQGILQEGLRYGRYLGVDNCEQSIRLAERKCNRRTQFVCADGSSFVADQPPNAVVMNEVLYYLPDPIGAVEHHARRLAPGGVVIISIYARTWSSRRLMRAIGARLEMLESNVIRSGHLAWAVAAYRPLRAPRPGQLRAPSLRPHCRYPSTCCRGLVRESSGSCANSRWARRWRSRSQH